MRILIEFFGKRVRTYIVEEELRLLRKEGEEEVDFDDEYWKWLRKKIDYDGEELFFEIVGREEELRIPPFFNVDEVRFIVKKVVEEEKEPEESYEESKTLLTYFRSKTKKRGAKLLKKRRFVKKSRN